MNIQGFQSKESYALEERRKKHDVTLFYQAVNNKIAIEIQEYIKPATRSNRHHHEKGTTVIVPSYPFFTEEAFNKFNDAIKHMPRCFKADTASVSEGEAPIIGDIRSSHESALSFREQHLYLELRDKYSTASTSLPTDEEIIEKRHFVELERRVLEENDMFQCYLERAAKGNRKLYLQNQLPVIRHVTDKFSVCKAHVKTYPQFYMEKKDITLAVKKASLLRFVLHATVQPQRDVPRLQRPKVDKPVLRTVFDAVNALDYAEKSRCSKRVISDRTCETLADQHNCQFVMSLNSLTCLINNCSPHYSNTWQLPISVKYITNTDGVRQKVVFIDKPLTKTVQTYREKNAGFYKTTLKIFLKPDVQKSQKVVASQGIKQTADFADALFDMSDQSDIESFGASNFKTSTKSDRKMKHAISNIRFGDFKSGRNDGFDDNGDMFGPDGFDEIETFGGSEPKMPRNSRNFRDSNAMFENASFDDIETFGGSSYSFPPVNAFDSKSIDVGHKPKPKRKPAFEPIAFVSAGIIQHGKKPDQNYGVEEGEISSSDDDAGDDVEDKKMDTTEQSSDTRDESTNNNTVLNDSIVDKSQVESERLNPSTQDESLVGSDNLMDTLEYVDLKPEISAVISSAGCTDGKIESVKSELRSESSKNDCTDLRMDFVKSGWQSESSKDDCTDEKMEVVKSELLSNSSADNASDEKIVMSEIVQGDTVTKELINSQNVITSEKSKPDAKSAKCDIMSEKMKAKINDTKPDVATLENDSKIQTHRRNLRSKVPKLDESVDSQTSADISMFSDTSDNESTKSNTGVRDKTCASASNTNKSAIKSRSSTRSSDNIVIETKIPSHSQSSDDGDDCVKSPIKTRSRRKISSAPVSDIESSLDLDIISGRKRCGRSQKLENTTPDKIAMDTHSIPGKNSSLEKDKNSISKNISNPDNISTPIRNLCDTSNNSKVVGSLDNFSSPDVINTSKHTTTDSSDDMNVPLRQLTIKTNSSLNRKNTDISTGENAQHNIPDPLGSELVSERDNCAKSSPDTAGDKNVCLQSDIHSLKLETGPIENNLKTQTQTEEPSDCDSLTTHMKNSPNKNIESTGKNLISYTNDVQKSPNRNHDTPSKNLKSHTNDIRKSPNENVDTPSDNLKSHTNDIPNSPNKNRNSTTDMHKSSVNTTGFLMTSHTDDSSDDDGLVIDVPTDGDCRRTSPHDLSQTVGNTSTPASPNPEPSRRSSRIQQKSQTLENTPGSPDTALSPPHSPDAPDSPDAPRSADAPTSPPRSPDAPSSPCPDIMNIDRADGTNMPIRIIPVPIFSSSDNDDGFKSPPSIDKMRSPPIIGQVTPPQESQNALNVRNEPQSPTQISSLTTQESFASPPSPLATSTHEKSPPQLKEMSPKIVISDNKLSHLPSGELKSTKNTQSTESTFPSDQNKNAQDNKKSKSCTQINDSGENLEISTDVNTSLLTPHTSASEIDVRMKGTKSKNVSVKPSPMTTLDAIMNLQKQTFKNTTGNREPPAPAPTTHNASDDIPNKTYQVWTLGEKRLLLRFGHHGIIKDKPHSEHAVSVCCKLEYQSQYGLEQTTLSEAVSAWITSYVKHDATLLRARVDVVTSELLLLEEVHHSQTLPVANKNLLEEGAYLLSHTQGSEVCKVRQGIDYTTREACYDLHTTYDKLQRPNANDAIPWIPLDPHMMLQSHWSSRTVPALFYPKDWQKHNSYPHNKLPPKKFSKKRGKNRRGRGGRGNKS